MPNDLRERFRRDAESVRRDDPVNALPQMLLGWLNDRAFRDSIRQIPATSRRAELAELGCEAFDRDIGSYASGLRRVAEGLDFVWPPDQREGIFRRHCGLLFANLADIVDFLDPAAARERLDEVEFLGLEHLQEARSDGNGVLVLSIHQSHPAFAFRHTLVQDVGVSAITNEPVKNAEVQAHLLDGLRERVELLPVSAAAVRPMFARFRGNGCVSIYADYLYTETPSIASALFGRVLPIASGAVHIAARNKIPVLPVSVARLWPADTAGVEVRMFSPIRIPPDLAAGTEADVLALFMGVAMEGMIRRRPESWKLWPTLLHRWAS